jgi:HK97 family phage major capsid protein
MSEAIVKGLLESRAADWERAKSLLTSAEAEKRELSVEENVEFDKLMAAMSDKDAKAQAVASAEERAVKVDAIRGKFEVAAAVAEAKGDEDGAAAIRAVALGERRSADFAIRAMTKSSNTVKTTFADFVVQYLTDVAPVYQYARKLRTSQGEDIVIPRITVNPAANWIGSEGGTITAGDPTITSVTLGAYKLAALTLMSSEILNDAAFDIAAYVGEHAGRQIALVAGSAFTVGTGSAQPTGFVTAATAASRTVTAAGSGTFFGATDVLDLVYSGLTAPYRNQDTVIFGSTTAVAKIRKLQDVNGQFLFTPGINGGQPDRLAGYTFVENASMAAVGSASKSLAVLHTPSYIVREVGNIQVAQSADRYFETDQVALRTIYRVDANLLDVNAVAVLVSKNT